MESHRVICSARSARKAGLVVNAHCHHCYELVYYIQDGGRTVLDGIPYTLHDGSFALIPPGVLHSEEHTSDNDVLFVQFQCSEPLDLMFSPDADKSVFRVAKVIDYELWNQPPEYEKMLALKIGELVLLLQRRQNRAVTQHNQKGFYYIIRYISENFHEKISFAELASRFNYSYDYFHHRFKDITGCSPREYLQNCRIHKAKELLRNTKLSCTEITYRCGFSHSTQLSRIFRQRTGMSPLQYRFAPSADTDSETNTMDGSDPF